MALRLVKLPKRHKPIQVVGFPHRYDVWDFEGIIDLLEATLQQDEPVPLLNRATNEYAVAYHGNVYPVEWVALGSDIPVVYTGHVVGWEDSAYIVDSDLHALLDHLGYWLMGYCDRMESETKSVRGQKGKS